MAILFENRNYGRLASSVEVRSFLLDKRGRGELPSEISDAVYTELRHLSPLLRAVSVDKIAARTIFRIYQPNELSDLDSAWIGLGRFPDLSAEHMVLAGRVDGYVVGAYAVLCNSFMDDMSAESVNAYVRSIARAVLASLEEAILRGDGKRKPKGIIQALPEDHKITVNMSASDEGVYVELINAAAKAQSGLFASPEEFHAVLNRKTTMMLLHAARSAETQAPAYLPRLMAKITLSERMQDGEILMGYLPAYHLFERKRLEAVSSPHNYIIEDNTIILARGEYDGFSFSEKAFVHVTLNPSSN